MKTLTNQQIFDKVATHLIKQGVRSYKKETGKSWDCRYRGPNGTKCAVGALIPDSVYERSLEGKSLDEITSTLKASGLPVESYETTLLLEDLMNLHDDTPTSEWVEQLVRIAANHKLDNSVLNGKG